MSKTQRLGLTLAIYGAVSVLFSWPLVLGLGSTHVSQQFDMYTLAWLVDAMSSPEASWIYPSTAWPVGEQVNRLDSFVLAGVAYGLGPWADAWLLPGLFALLGPVCSALAAERVAVWSFGARWPWSIVAGFCFGFTGLCATALLEGHVYAMMLPWLPLLLHHWMRALGGGGTVRDGVLAGLWWSLSLLTSAYTGIAATIVVLIVGLFALFRGRRSPKPIAAAAAVAGAVGAWYIWVFTTWGASSRSPAALVENNPIKVMDAGSLHLDTLSGWNGALDMIKHSVTGSLGFTGIALLLFAPFVLRRSERFRTMFVLFLLGLVMAFGPQIQLHDDDLNLPWVLYPLSYLGDKASFFQFPVRMLWIAVLAMSMLSAKMLTVLARSRGARWAAPVLLFAVVDALCITGAPFRTRTVPRTTPSIYAHAPGQRAVLDLFPTFGTFKADLSLFTNNLTCAYQADHGRVIANQCLGTTLGVGPRAVLGKWMGDRLMAEQGMDKVVLGLSEMGFGAVVVHPDTFSRAVRKTIVTEMGQAFGTPIATTRDGGEYLVMYEVPLPRRGYEKVVRESRYAELEKKYQ